MDQRKIYISTTASDAHETAKRYDLGMATFEEADIDDGYLDEIRQGDKFTVEGSV